jgi:predicted transcriptional regulator
MEQVIKFIQNIFDSADAFMRVGDYVSDDDSEDESEDRGDNIILIKNISIDNTGIAHFLIHHGDARAADPAFIKIRSGEVRKAGKRPDEGLGHASHLMISTTASKAGQYRALLERVPNLGRSTVMAFLNRLLRKEAKRLDLTFDKSNRQYRYHPKLLAHQPMSYKLKSDLKTGKLSRIEFVSHHVADGFEEKDRVIPVTHTIVHKVINAPTGQRVFDLIERARAKARKLNFEQMQLRFRKTDTDQHVSPRFATDLSDAEDVVYSRFEVLPRFGSPLEQCPKEFVPAIQSAMKKLFDNKELWK